MTKPYRELITVSPSDIDSGPNNPRRQSRKQSRAISNDANKIAANVEAAIFCNRDHEENYFDQVLAIACRGRSRRQRGMLLAVLPPLSYSPAPSGAPVTRFTNQLAAYKRPFIVEKLLAELRQKGWRPKERTS
jgi:hypothetical protein